MGNTDIKTERERETDIQHTVAHRQQRARYKHILKDIIYTKY